MSKLLASIEPEIAAWIAEQPVYFVATAPLAANAHVNVSPKGGDSFRVLGPLEAAYQDYTGSGAETAAHLRENGRIVVMFCAFKGSPRILRLHGRGTVITTNDTRFGGLAGHFPANPGTRAIVHIDVDRVTTSCGYSVPLLDFRGRRDALDKWSSTKGPEELREYRHLKNRHSIDGLPAFD